MREPGASFAAGWPDLVSIRRRQGRSLGCTFVVKCHSHFFSAFERSTDISIVRASIERYYPIAVLAVRLEAIANVSRPLAEYLRAFGAFNFYFFVSHEMSRHRLVALAGGPVPLAAQAVVRAAMEALVETVHIRSFLFALSLSVS
jgi:hypothetical protein